MISSRKLVAVLAMLGAANAGGFPTKIPSLTSIDYSQAGKMSMVIASEADSAVDKIQIRYNAACVFKADPKSPNAICTTDTWEVKLADAKTYDYTTDKCNGDKGDIITKSTEISWKGAITNKTPAICLLINGFDHSSSSGAEGDGKAKRLIILGFEGPEYPYLAPTAVTADYTTGSAFQNGSQAARQKFKVDWTPASLNNSRNPGFLVQFKSKQTTTYTNLADIIAASDSAAACTGPIFLGDATTTELGCTQGTDKTGVQCVNDTHWGATGDAAAVAMKKTAVNWAAGLTKATVDADGFAGKTPDGAGAAADAWATSCTALLVPTGAYKFQVKATSTKWDKSALAVGDAVVAKESSGSWLYSASAPSCPLALNPTWNATTKKVGLSWNAPATDGGGIAGYFIYTSYWPNVNTKSTNAANIFAKTDQKAKATRSLETEQAIADTRAQVYFNVAAVSAALVSITSFERVYKHADDKVKDCFANEAMIWTLRANQLMYPPTGLFAWSKDIKSVNLQWSAPKPYDNANKKLAAVTKYSVYGSKLYKTGDGFAWFKAGTNDVDGGTGAENPKAGGHGDKGAKTCKGDGTLAAVTCEDAYDADKTGDSNAFYWVQGLSGAFQGPFTPAYRAWYLATPAADTCKPAAVAAADGANGTKKNSSIGVKWTVPASGGTTKCKMPGQQLAWQLQYTEDSGSINPTNPDRNWEVLNPGSETGNPTTTAGVTNYRIDLAAVATSVTNIKVKVSLRTQYRTDVDNNTPGTGLESADIGVKDPSGKHPKKPVGKLQTDFNPTQIKVSFTAGDAVTDADVTHYTCEVSKVTTGVNAALAIKATAADGWHWKPIGGKVDKSTVAFTELLTAPDKNVRYYRCKAVSADSESKWSTTGAAPKAYYGIGLPGKVQNFVAKCTTKDNVVLTWDADTTYTGDSTAVKYNYFYKDSADFTTLAKTKSNDTATKKGPGGDTPSTDLTETISTSFSLDNKQIFMRIFASNTVHEDNDYDDADAKIGPLSDPQSFWNCAAPTFTTSTWVVHADYKNAASLNLKWGAVGESNASCTNKKMHWWRMAGSGSDVKTKVDACVSNAKATGCEAAFFDNSAKLSTSATEAFTYNPGSTIGYWQFSIRIENVNPNAPKTGSMPKEVVTTTTTGAPGQLKAACTLSGTGLAASVAFNTIAADYKGASEITTYVIQYTMQKTKTPTWTTAKKDAACTDALTFTSSPGTKTLCTSEAQGEYFFQVAATNTQGTSAYVACTGSFIFTKANVVSAPTVLDPTAATDKGRELQNLSKGNGFTAEWTANGAVTATSWKVMKATSQFGTYDSAGTVAKDGENPLATKLAITSLTSGQEYWIKVIGVVTAGDGPASAPVRYYASYLPKVPTSLAVVANTDTTSAISVPKVTWKKPQDFSGEKISSYNLFAKKATTFTKTTESTSTDYKSFATDHGTEDCAATKSGTKCTFKSTVLTESVEWTSSLAFGKWFFRIQSVNALGASNYSAATTELVVYKGVAAKPTISSLAQNFPGPITTVTVSLTGLGAQVGNAGSEVLGYKLQTASGEYKSSDWWKDVTIADPGYFTGADKAVISTAMTYAYKPSTAPSIGSHFFRVMAFNGKNGVWSDLKEIKIMDAPVAPALKYKADTTDADTTSNKAAINLEWTAPDARGSAITGYTVVYGRIKKACADYEKVATVTTLTYKHAISSLGSYYYCLFATNASGNSAYSSVVGPIESKVNGATNPNPPAIAQTASTTWQSGSLLVTVTQGEKTNSSTVNEDIMVEWSVGNTVGPWTLVFTIDDLSNAGSKTAKNIVIPASEYGVYYLRARSAYDKTDLSTSVSAYTTSDTKFYVATAPIKPVLKAQTTFSGTGITFTFTAGAEDKTNGIPSDGGITMEKWQANARKTTMSSDLAQAADLTSSVDPKTTPTDIAWNKDTTTFSGTLTTDHTTNKAWVAVRGKNTAALWSVREQKEYRVQAPPGAPSGIAHDLVAQAALSSNKDTQIALKWSLGAANSLTIEKTQMESKLKTDSDGKAVAWPTSPTQTDFNNPKVAGVVGSLTKDTIYVFRGKTISTQASAGDNPKVCSGLSSEFDKAYTATLPGAPTVASQSEIFKDKVVLTWTMAPNTGYKLAPMKKTVVTYADSSSGSFSNIWPHYETSETTITHIIDATNTDSLKKDYKTPLSYRVNAVNELGKSADATPTDCEFRDPVSAPTGIAQLYKTVTAKAEDSKYLEENKILVTWTPIDGSKTYTCQSAKTPTTAPTTTNIACADGATSASAAGIFTVDSAKNPKTVNCLWTGSSAGDRTASQPQFFRMRRKAEVTNAEGVKSDSEGAWSTLKGLYHQWAAAPASDSFKQDGYSSAAIKFNWKAPVKNESGSGITKYLISYAPLPQDTFTMIDDKGVAATATLEYSDSNAKSVKKDQLTFYQIYSFNGAGRGKPSGSVGFIAATLPGKPGAISLVTPQTDSSFVSFKWVAAADTSANADMKVASYTVEQANDDKTTWTAISCADAAKAECKLASTTAGKQYTFRVKANVKNSKYGSTAYTESSAFTAKGPATKIANLKTEGTYENKVNLVWDYSKDNGEVTNYAVSYYITPPAEGKEAVYIAITDAAKLDQAKKGETKVRYTHTGLEMAKDKDGKVKASTSVYYKVWAYNSIGPTGDALKGAKVAVTATLAKAPGAPEVSQDATTYSKTVIKVKFTAPTWTSTTDKLIGFDIETRALGTKDWKSGGSPTEKATTHDVNVDKPGKHEIRIRAKTALYTGEWSTVLTGIAAVAPSPPTLDAQTVFTGTKVTLNWTPGENGGLDIAKYMIYIDTAAGTKDKAFAADKLVHTTLGPQISYEYTAAANTYYVKISARNDIPGTAGEGKQMSESVAVYITEPPTVPTELKFGAIAADKVALSWTGPKETTGITYTVESSINAGATTPTWATAGTANLATAKLDDTPSKRDTAQGGKIYYRVRSQKEVGTTTKKLIWSAWSATGFGYMCAVPTATTLTAQTTSDQKQFALDKVTIGWAAAADNKCMVTQYNVEYQKTAKTDKAAAEFVAACETAVATFADPKTGKGAVATALKCVDSTARTAGAHTYQVKAKNAAGSSKASAAVVFYYASAPGAPATPKKVSTSATKVKISWRKPSDTNGFAIKSYNIYMDDGVNTPTKTDAKIPTVEGSNPYEYELTTTGQGYLKFTVSAVNDKDWEGKQSSAVEILSSAGPGRPTLSFTKETAAQVILSWSKPSDLNGNTKISNWEIYRGLFKDDLSALKTVSNLKDDKEVPVLTYTDTTSAIRSGQVFYKVRCQGDKGWSPFSLVKSANASDLSATSYPKKLAQVTPFNTDELHMTWEATAKATYTLSYADLTTMTTIADRTKALDGRYSDAAECNKIAENVCRYRGSAFSSILTPDNYNGSRYWRIRLTDETKGSSPMSPPVAMWKAKAPEAPGVVSGKAATTDSVTGVKTNYYATASKVYIQWTATAQKGQNGIQGDVKEDTNFGITNYSILYGMEKGKSTTAAAAYTKTRDATTNVLLTTYTHDVADASFKRGSYFYVVKGSTIAGESVASADMATGILSAKAPEAPTAVIADPDFTQTADKLKIKWTAPTVTNGSAITKYYVYYSINSSAAALTKLAAEPSATSLEIDATDPKTFKDGLYYFQVSAVNTLDGVDQLGVSEKSAVGPVLGILSGSPFPPDAPTGVKGPASDATSGETCLKVPVNWTAPANNGGSPVTSYTVYRGTTADAKAKAGTPTTTTFEDTTPGAGDDGLVYYRVSATNKVGEGKMSDKLATGFLAACKPTAPSSLAEKEGAKETGKAVNIKWTASDKKGSTITTYNVWYKIGDAAAVNANLGKPVTGTEYELDATSIANGKIKFYVTATNIKGTSVNSNEIELYSADKPSAPAGLAGTHSEDKSKITLTWTKAVDNGAPLTGYSFSMAINKLAAKITTTTKTEATTTFLSEPGNDYIFMVAASNIKGTGAFSTAVTVKIAPNQSIIQEAVTALTQIVSVANVPKASGRGGGGRRRGRAGWKKGAKKAAAKADKADSKAAEGDGDTKDGEGKEDDDDEKLDYEFGDNALNFEF